ncbi:unnamed protein product [Ixodes persulcatus]
MSFAVFAAAVFCCTVHTEACAGDQLRPMGPYQITQPRVWPLPLTINLVQPGDYGQLLGHPLQAVSPSEVERIVALHNDLRNDLASGNMAGFPSAANMLRLEYDGELAQLAQIHSQSCQFQHGCVGCGRIGKYLGQNLFLSPRGNWEQAIMTWWNEHRRTNSFTIYNYQFSPLNGHFTQMAWAKNIKIGCGATDCHQLGGARYMVCHYIPGGNMVGQPVYERGTPCSKCPELSTCGDVKGEAVSPSLCRITGLGNPVWNRSVSKEDFSRYNFTWNLYNTYKP